MVLKSCSNCRWEHVAEEDYPCAQCKLNYLTSSDEYDRMPLLWESAEEASDAVNHPSHYNKGKIEVADFISDQKLNFDRGNAVKYVCRAGDKDPDAEVQDLEKAIWYIQHEIKVLKGEI